MIYQWSERIEMANRAKGDADSPAVEEKSILGAQRRSPAMCRNVPKKVLRAINYSPSKAPNMY